jgi:hypothetical protein
MSRSFGLVDYKVQEAEYFLLMMDREGRKNFFGVQFCASAFVSAARSITFAMQSSLAGTPAFDAWYKPRQAILRSDPLARFFHDFRTLTQHIGENMVGGGSHGKEGTRYWFTPHPELLSVPEQDVLTASKAYFVQILQLVYDCYIELGPLIDGQQHFTYKHYASLGKTIEDAEQAMGWPKGFTDIGDPDALPYRWELIRKHADGCNIEAQFEEWLGRYLPRPEPLPPYQSRTVQHHG